MYKLEATQRYLKTARKFIQHHPQLKLILRNVMTLLMSNPHQPELRLHQLEGKLKKLSAIRLTYKFRIILIINKKTRTITLLDIGSHDEVYN
ncbi:MAG: type II toxin-antitoxin system YafQ family toxin [Candidatus Marinimicrobia bacterium]|nr:type II toxin-antitoxin system YafQ family toxin [Candidatus Neomarinimicrobiota bacterium]